MNFQPEGEGNNYKDVQYSILFRLVALLVYVLFFGLSYQSERWLSSSSSQTVAAGTVLLVMLVAEYAALVLTLLSDPEAETEVVNSASRTRPIFYLIICNELLLPFSRRVYPFAASTLIVFWEIALTFITSRSTTHLCYEQQENSHLQSESNALSLSKTEVRHLLADMLFYLFAAGVAFYVTYLLEIVNRRAFLDHRKCVESKYKLTHEKDEQERLLSSCLPKHLMKKVREDIRSRFTMNRQPRHLTTSSKTPTSKLQCNGASAHLHCNGSVKRTSKLDGNNNCSSNGVSITSNKSHHHGGSSSSISRPFKELYIDKHENVTILFADIINSMLLTSVLSSPKALVETLNDLFGRFDASAEVLQILNMMIRMFYNKKNNFVVTEAQLFENQIAWRLLLLHFKHT